MKSPVVHILTTVKKVWRHFIQKCYYFGKEKDQTGREQKGATKAQTKSTGVQNREDIQTGGWKIARMAEHRQALLLVLFKATFAQGNVTKTIMGSKRADINFMPATTRGRAIQAIPEELVRTLQPRTNHQGISSYVWVACTKRVIENICLKLKHRRRLLRQNVLWEVSEENTTRAIRERQFWNPISVKARRS